MTSEPLQPGKTDAEQASPHVFPVLTLAGAVEALEATLDRKLKTCWSLGERETAERLREAFELARAKLIQVLSSPSRHPGS